MNIMYRTIGFFTTPHKRIEGMPIQPLGAQGVHGTITLLPEFSEGLADLDGFSHVIILYHLHEVCGQELTVTPFLDTKSHGIFATRSPNRPNPVGLSVLELSEVSGRVVHVDNVDVLDGTPVLDIKPYVPDFDVWPARRIGWFAGRSAKATHWLSDGRFSNRTRTCKTQAAPGSLAATPTAEGV